MSAEDFGSWGDLLEEALRHSGLVLAVVTIILARLFKKRSEPRTDRPATRTSWSGESYKQTPQSQVQDSLAGTQPAVMTSMWQKDMNPNRREENDGALVWGSTFASDASEKKWGFDENEWGSDFQKKSEQEPKITIG